MNSEPLPREWRRFAVSRAAHYRKAYGWRQSLAKKMAALEVQHRIKFAARFGEEVARIAPFVVEPPNDEHETWLVGFPFLWTDVDRDTKGWAVGRITNPVVNAIHSGMRSPEGLRLTGGL